MSRIGIFWYDEYNETLIGVFSAEEEDITPFPDGRRVFPILHRDIWDEKRSECFDIYGDIKEGYGDSIFLEEDYTLIPRGRVSSDDEGYQVFIGSWIDQDYEYIKQLILDEFNLWEEETDFIYDIHWEIGHGWSE